MAGRQIRERTANNMPGIHDPKSKQTSWVPSGFLCVREPCTFWYLGYQPSQITGVASVSGSDACENNLAHVSVSCSVGRHGLDTLTLVSNSASLSKVTVGS